MKQLSFLGGKAGRINAANTDWNFTNVITPLTEQLNIDQMCEMLFDNGSVAPSTSTFSSSSVVSSTGMNSLSSCSNDNYYFSEDE